MKLKRPVALCVALATTLLLPCYDLHAGDAAPGGPRWTETPPLLPEPTVLEAELSEPLVVRSPATNPTVELKDPNSGSMGLWPARAQVLLRVTKPIGALHFYALGKTSTSDILVQQLTDGKAKIATAGKGHVTMAHPAGDYAVSVRSTTPGETGVIVVGEQTKVDHAFVSPYLPSSLALDQRAARDWYPLLGGSPTSQASFEHDAARKALFLGATKQLFVSPTADLTAAAITNRPFELPLPVRGEALLALSQRGGEIEVLTADGRALRVDRRVLGELAPHATVPDVARLATKPAANFAAAYKLASTEERAKYKGLHDRLDKYDACYLSGTNGLSPTYPPHAKIREQVAKRCGAAALFAERNQAVVGLNAAWTKRRTADLKEIAARLQGL